MYGKVRVLHYIGSLDFGGSQMFVMNIYRVIDRDKLQFDFVAFPNEKEGFYNEIIRLGGKVFECPRYNGKNHFVFINWWKDFFRIHKEYRILHGHVRSVASLYLPIAKKAGLYTIAHSHSTSNGGGIIGKIKDILQYPVRTQADFLFACSDEAGLWMYGKRAIKRKNYKVISNAIDVKRFAYNLEKRKEIRTQLAIDDKYVVGTIGRLSKPKNHRFLINVFASLHKLDTKTVLLLVGDGELRSELEMQVNRTGLKDSVIFVGSRSNTQDYYQAMDVFAFPSLWEGLGMSVIEAQCSGLHCVVSERIPDAVNMMVGLVDVRSLSDKEGWIETLRQTNGSRKSQLEAVREAGYDVTENASRLERFYIKISNENQEITLCI